MKRMKLLAVVNALAFMLHVFISYSTQFKLINKKDVGEVSANYTSLFTPAPVTFAIWGLIYFSLLCFSIYHIIMAWRQPASDPANKDLKKIGGWFIFNNLATAAWLIAWTNELLGISVALIFLQLMSLVFINNRLPVYDRSREIASKVFTQFPISIYFAWLTIATIANASSYLAALKWSAGITAVNWTVIMITIAVLLTIMVVLTKKNVFYGMVVIWALYGIVLKRQMEPADGNLLIANAAWIGIIATGVICMYQIIKNSSAHKRVNRFSNHVHQ